MSQVKFGVIVKPINSTSRVISGGAITRDCKLKEPCSLHDPVFIVQGLDKTPTHQYNYAIWNNMYYWIKDVVYKTRDIVEVYCSLDPLATYRDKIKEVRAFIQYSDEDNWQKKIDDIRFNPEVEAPAGTQSALSYEADIPNLIPGLDTTGSGMVVMRYVDASSTSGGVKTVAMTQNQFSNILSYLYNSISGASIDKIIGTIAGSCAWIDNIVSCIWVPFSESAFSDMAITSVTKISIGNVDCPENPNGNMYIINPLVIINNLSFRYHIDLKWGVFATQECEFLKNERWTALQVVTPFGYANIPCDDLVLQPHLYYGTVANMTTGDIVISFTENFDNDGQVFATFSGNVSVDLMSLLGNGNGYGAQMVESFSRGFGTGWEVGKSILTKGMSSGVHYYNSEMASMFANRAESAGKYTSALHYKTTADIEDYKLQNDVATIGVDSVPQSLPGGRSVGCASGKLSCGPLGLFMRTTFGTGKFIRKTYMPADLGNYKAFCGLHGYPCNRFLTVGDCDGFIKCSGAYIRQPDGATFQDMVTINSYLNNGIVIAE